MDHNIYRASFNPIAPNKESPSNDLLEEECKRILTANEQVEIGQVDQHFPHFPYITRLILSLYYTLARSTSTTIQKCPLTTFPPTVAIRVTPSPPTLNAHF